VNRPTHGTFALGILVRREGPDGPWSDLGLVSTVGQVSLHLDDHRLPTLESDTRSTGAVTQFRRLADVTLRPALAARAMTGIIGFDGLQVTIRPYALADERPPATVRLSLAEIGAVEWWPATNIHRGVLRFAGLGANDRLVELFDLGPLLPPVEDERSVSFKLRQQDDIAAIRDAVAARLP
jgi:hypothetical protein